MAGRRETLMTELSICGDLLAVKSNEEKPVNGVAYGHLKCTVCLCAGPVFDPLIRTETPAAVHS